MQIPSEKQTSLLISAGSGALGALVVLAVFFGALNVRPDLARQLLPSPYIQEAPTQSLPPQDVSAMAERPSVTQVVKKADPAVVSIVISKDVPILERSQDAMPLDPFGLFQDPFFSQPQYEQRGTERREVGGGSGFIVSEDGYLITNRHVVDSDDADYTVFTNDGEQHDATVVARDPLTDIAVLKIDGNGYPTLDFANSDDAEVGQTVIAIGNALAEFRNTVSVGVISGLQRSISAGDGTGSSERLEGVIQTDAAINPGNSGGPLLTLDGKVIGVNVAIANGSQNIGFALPSNVVESVVTSVKEHGRIIRPFLGIRYIPITKSLKDKNKLPVDYGVLISRGETREDLAVMPGSAAEKAGLRENDIILEIDGTKLDEDHSLSALIRNHEVGDTVTLKLLRQGEEQNVDVTLQEVPE